MKKNKKFRQFIILAIVAIVLAAYFTKPGKEAFINHIQKEQALQSAPIVEEKDNFLYKSFTVTFFQQQPRSDSSGMIAVSSDKQKYLGLFGKFWKMD